MRPIWLLALASLVAAAGCDTTDDATRYTLELVDADGARVADGRIALESPITAGTSVLGTYVLSREG